MPIRNAVGPTFTLSERLYTDKDGKVVKADDPNRLRLLGNAGGTIPMAEAKRLGLADADGQPVESRPAEAPEAADAPRAEGGKSGGLFRSGAAKAEPQHKAGEKS